MYNTKENVETKNEDWSKNWEMCHTFVSKHAIRAVQVALMSLGMSFSFTPEVQITKNYWIINHASVVSSNEWFSSNRIPMFYAQDFGIARGQTLRVATKKCMAWSCFCVKSSVFGHRMPHFAVILGETEVTNVGALKFQVSVWLMR